MRESSGENVRFAQIFRPKGLLVLLGIHFSRFSKDSSAPTKIDYFIFGLKIIREWTCTNLYIQLLNSVDMYILGCLYYYICRNLNDFVLNLHSSAPVF